MSGVDNNNNAPFPKVDLNAFADSEHFDLHISSRGKETLEDAKLRRFKDKWLFIATLLAIACVFVICIVFFLLVKNSPHTGIALNGVIGLGMALSGYYVRGK